MFFRFLVLIHACTAFPLQCPEPAQWSIRARGLCPDPSKYSCLMNDLINGYSENCTISDFQAPGRKGVLRGGLDADICSAERYHPWPIKYYTNVSTNCIFLKSVCNGEGQVVYAKGNRNTDITCRCDYTRGYDFIGKPRNSCYCVPSEEDCSCYLKTCIDQIYYLSPDYECIHEKMNTSTSNCQTITRKSVTKDRNDSNTTDTTILEHTQTPVQRKFYSRIIVIAFCIGFILVYCIYELMEKATCKATPFFKMSQPKIGYNPKEEDFDHQAIVRFGGSSLQTECDAIKDLKITSSAGKVPDLMITKLDQWKEDEAYFVETTASNYVMRCLLDNQCVSVVGSPGVGKTFLVQHIALIMQQMGYTIVCANEPKDIKDSYKLNRKTLFVVDDMCGNFTANTERLDDWKKSMKDITAILDNDSNKLILTCRIQVFHDEGFKHSNLQLFKTCVCNLADQELALTLYEKDKISEKYFEYKLRRKLTVLYQYESFPLLCKLYVKNKNKHKFSLKNFLKNPFQWYETELNDLFVDCKDGKHKFSALLLLVVCNNHLEKKLLANKNDRIKQILEAIFEECDTEQITAKRLIPVLDTLIGTFVSIENDIYHTIHDKLFDFLVYYFGKENKVTSKEMIGLLIKHAGKYFIMERFIIRELDHRDDIKREDYLITIQDKNIPLYIWRVFSDLTKSDSIGSYLHNNRNINNKKFQVELSTFLNQLPKDKISNLIQIASSYFVCSMFVMNVSDIMSFYKHTYYGYEHYGIILGADHLQKYIERLFDEMTKSDQVASYMSRCRCCRNEEFRSAFIDYICSTNSAELIQTASTDFVQNMFVMKANDIYPTSPNVCLRYGIELSGDLIQVYCEKVFNEMTSCKCVEYFIRTCRCSKNKGFEKALQNFMSQLSLPRVEELIKNASSSFVQSMCVVSVEDIKPKSRESYMHYGIILTTDIINDYVERVFNDLTSSKDVKKHIKNNRNRKNTKFHAELLHHMTKLDRTKIEHLIEKASQDFIYQLCVMGKDDINEISSNECERYGVIIPDECIQVYIDRWFDEIITSDDIFTYFDANRNRHTNKFKTALAAYMAELQDENIEKLIKTVRGEFLHQMFVTTKTDIKNDNIIELEHYGIVLQDKYMNMYTDQILDSQYLEKYIKHNRSRKGVLKCLRQFGIPKITELIHASNIYVFHQMIIIDIENELQLDKMCPDSQCPDSTVENNLKMEEALIKCPASLIDLYMDRMISDWSKGESYAVLNNKNLKNHSFVDKFLGHLSLKPSEISELAYTKDNRKNSLCISCHFAEVHIAKLFLEHYLHENPEQEHNRLFALFLLVFYDNHLVETIINDELIKITDVKFSFRKILLIREDISAKVVKEELTNTSLYSFNREDGIDDHYLIDDRVFSFVVLYFASIRQMSKEIVEYADEKFLCKWFLFEKDFYCDQHFNISLPDDELSTCVRRVLTKMTNSGEFIRYMLEQKNKTNLNSITAFVRNLNKKEKITIIENSCTDFLNKICVVTAKDTQGHSDGESELYIVIPDESIPYYIKRIFDHIANSDCVEECLHGNRNKRNDTFYTKLVTHMNRLTRDEIERLIHQANSDFINRMFVISEDDTKPESCWEYERYGIAVPKDLLQIYIKRVFSDMKTSVHVSVNRNSENKSFCDTLHSYISSFSEETLTSWIDKANSKFISQMSLSTKSYTSMIRSQILVYNYMLVPRRYFRISKQKMQKMLRSTRSETIGKHRRIHKRYKFKNDSNEFKIDTYRYKDSDNVLIRVNNEKKIKIDILKEHVIKYIDPLFIGHTIECFIKSTNRLIWKKYIQRMLQDWTAGNVHDVFGNTNLENHSFQKEFITHLRNSDSVTQTGLSLVNDNSTGYSPLAACCYVGNLQLAEWCLDNITKNRNLEIYNNIVRPLHVACFQNHRDIVIIILNHKDMYLFKHYFNLTFYFACKFDDKVVFTHLIQKKLDVNEDDHRKETPLFAACKNGHSEIVSILLEQKADEIDINKDRSNYRDKKETPLYIACKKGHTKIVSLLLNHVEDEVDVNKHTHDGETPLYAACEGGFKDIVALLLEHQYLELNKSRFDGTTSLFVACQEGHDEVVFTLLSQKGIEIDKCMISGMSPLFIASLLGHTKIVEMLLDRNADSFICVRKKEHVKHLFKTLQKYRSRRHWRCTEFDINTNIVYLKKMVSRIASKHWKSQEDDMVEDWVSNLIFGSSPLHIGCALGHTEIVKLLVDKISDINLLNENGSTPLWLANKEGHEDIVGILLSKGAEQRLD